MKNENEKAKIKIIKFGILRYKFKINESNKLISWVTTESMGYFFISNIN